jgi:hypothetical protein
VNAIAPASQRTRFMQTGNEEIHSQKLLQNRIDDDPSIILGL